MSQEPEPPPASPAALRDGRRVAVGMWAAMLLTLLVTSWAGLGTSINGNGLNESIVTYLSIALSGAPKDGVPETIAIVALAVTFAIAGVLLLGWLRFAQATRQMLDGLDDASDDADAVPVTSYWLPADDSSRSELLDLLAYVGAAWSLIILRPAILGTVQVFLV